MDKFKPGQDSKKSEQGKYNDCESPTSTGRDILQAKSGYQTTSQDNDKSSGYQSNKKQSARTRMKKQELLSVFHSESDMLSKELIDLKPELQLLRRKHAHLLVLKKRMLDELHDIQLDSDVSTQRNKMMRLPKLVLDGPSSFMDQQSSPHNQVADLAALMQSGSAHYPVMGQFGSDFQHPVSPIFPNQQNSTFLSTGLQSSSLNGNNYMSAAGQQQFRHGQPGVDLEAIINQQLQMRQNI